jgi:SRSO17 transposase
VQENTSARPGLLAGLAHELKKMTDRFAGLFATHGSDNAPTAHKYICGLVQTEHANMERMEEQVEGLNYQSTQQFLTDSPWDHRAVMDKVALDASALLGGAAPTALLLDETSFIKKGKESAGVARQWSGRLGKVDNCQVAVFGVLSAGARALPVDGRLYLPGEWIGDPARCRKAGIPEAECAAPRTKPELALAIVRHQRALGVDFQWVGADGLYGNNPAFLRALDDDGERFIIDVHADQRIYREDPCPRAPEFKGRGRKPARLTTQAEPVRVDKYVAELAPEHWQRLSVRAAENGPLQIDFHRSAVWVWDGAEPQARRWALAVRRDAASGPIKYSLSNAGAEVTDLELAQAQAQRFWIERAFEDAKKEARMACYQVRQWLAWQHHIALVMMVLLFMTRQRMVLAEEQPLLTCHDIRCLLAFFLPRRATSEVEILRQMEERHRKRLAARRKPREGLPPPPDAPMINGSRPDGT